MADALRDWLVERMGDSHKCESPIERLFLAAYRFMERGHNLPEGKDLAIRVEQQVTRGSYRLDFVFSVLDLSGERQFLAVELDGHDFHEKTKEQAARDKKRDREILAAGYPVMRFSGSEIYRDALGCAEQLLSPLNDVLLRVSRDGGLFDAVKPEATPDA